MTYSDTLRDPNWQRKRLQIMDRDGWTCRHCRATNKTLHVHHSYYLKGVKPWEYPDDGLITLCEDCHNHEEIRLKHWADNLVSGLRVLGADSWCINALFNAVTAGSKVLTLSRDDFLVATFTLHRLIESKDGIEGATQDLWESAKKNRDDFLAGRLSIREQELKQTNKCERAQQLEFVKASHASR